MRCLADRRYYRVIHHRQPPSQPTLAPSGWNGFPHDDKDMRSRLFEWLGELAGILPRDEEGDKGSSHNAELIMAFALLDRCAGPLS